MVQSVDTRKTKQKQIHTKKGTWVTTARDKSKIHSHEMRLIREEELNIITSKTRSQSSIKDKVSI